MKTIFDKLECMKRDKTNRCELYLPQKTSFQGMCSTGSQNAQNRFWWGMAGGLVSWLYGQGFLDCWVVGPWVKNSKMITADLSKMSFMSKSLKTL